MNPYVGDPPTSTGCMDLVIPNAFQYGEPLVIEGSVSSGSMNAFAADFIDGIGVLALTDCDLASLNFSLQLSELLYGTYELTVIDWTDDPACSLRVDQTMVVADPITDLNASTVPDVAICNETEIKLALWVTEGTQAIVSVDWGDGVLSVMTCVGADLSVLTCNHTYRITGNFTVSGSASNTLTTKLLNNQTIYVQERIRDLAIYGNSSVLTPPGTGIWQIQAGADQLSLKNVFCSWNMGTNYGDTEYYIPWLNSTEFHQITFNYIQSDIGTQTVHVNCSNTVSSQNMSMDVNVIWDDVTLGELICNSSTMWNYSITCQLTIVRFGTGACFEWNMGDGKPAIYYQDGYCVAGVPAASPTYVQVFLPSSNRLLQLSFTIFFM